MLMMHGLVWIFEVLDWVMKGFKLCSRRALTHHWISLRDQPLAHNHSSMVVYWDPSETRTKVYSKGHRHHSKINWNIAITTEPSQHKESQQEATDQFLTCDHIKAKRPRLNANRSAAVHSKLWQSCPSRRAPVSRVDRLTPIAVPTGFSRRTWNASTQVNHFKLVGLLRAQTRHKSKMTVSSRRLPPAGVVSLPSCWGYCVLCRGSLREGAFNCATIGIFINIS